MIEKISDSVYAETGLRGCNHSFIVTSEGVVMIDTPQFPADAIAWRDYIAKFGPIRYIINNEPHGDHIAGNYFFDGTIIAHELARQAILATPLQTYIDTVKQMEPASLPLLQDYRFRVPTMTLSQRMTLHLGQHTFQLANFPGHTPGQLAVYVPEEKVLFTSDNVVRISLPFIFPPALLSEWLDSLKRMQELDVKVLVPGHGNIGDKSCLAEMTAQLQMWIDAVSGAMKKGMSLAEIQDKVSLLDKYANAPMPKERLISTQKMNLGSIYDWLSKQKKKT